MSTFQDSLEAVLTTFQTLSKLRPPLELAVEDVAGALRSGHKLLLCGNGGSAAEAAHIATEFTCRFCEDRRPYPAMALSTDGGLLTAIVNDYCGDELFARQVRAFGVAGDVLIALSTSGASRNVLRAIEEAKQKGVRTIAFLGKGGGLTRGVADVELIVEGQNTARIQEAHQFLLHVLCEQVELRLPRT